MEGVSGIGGVFLRARDPEALRAWYGEYLGIAVEDWGGVCDYSDIPRGGVARIVQPAVAALEDWRRLEPLELTAGSLRRELDHFARVVELLGPMVPVLATVFSPLTIAAKLSNGAHREHLARDAAAVARGLEVVTAVTAPAFRQRNTLLAGPE